MLGRPVIVLNMPTHLRDLVAAGVALGVAEGDDPRPALAGALVRRGGARGARRGARARYLADLAMGVDGRATARIVGLLRDSGRNRRAAGMVV